MWATRIIVVVLNVVNLLLGSPSAHGQAAAIVNDHPATATEASALAQFGITAGTWRADGWGIALASPAAVTPQAPQCHFVLDVPLDCNVVMASR